MVKSRRDASLRARIVDIAPLTGVRAGSAVVFCDGRLLLIQDDAHEAVWVDPRSRALERIALEGSGERLPKPKKPDFEAAFVGPGRAVTILGSGSAASRRRAVCIHLDDGAVRHHDCGGIFDALTARLGASPNVEGAILAGDVLRLFHRGAGPIPSAVVDVPAAAIEGGEASILAFTLHDLGHAAGVPLHFTDAVTLGALSLYLAVAEDTPNAIDDGPIAGAAVGLIEGESARFAILEEPDGRPTARKVEGIAIDPSSGETWLVTDPDDPDRPAELCRLALEGFGETK
ncbi:DUF6929 family protein [Polyangium aurulentum]|uniref:DUF6929 family protein n=1 Tax=Polyangium aurulentum TaxID=2567896 RepID=UPI0010AE6E6C|nr:hypothetical protein [Polyangium aurulentum]UQA61957.1 hypothetical protein E8A73_016380 [Polyangium aurulentum]